MNKKAQQLQRQIFYQVLAKLKAQNRKVEELSELLNIRKTALYNRIKGSKPLTLDELLVLSREFGIQLDEQIALANSFIPLQFPSLQKKVTSGKYFVENLLERMEGIALLEGVRIRYISAEVPVFYYFKFRELSLFKLFIYKQTVWEIPTSIEQKINFERMDEEDYGHLFSRIYNIYQGIPSTEIWTSSLVDNTLNQIRYYVESRIFKHLGDALLLCNQLEELLRELMLCAEKGYKNDEDGSRGGAFILFHNEILRTNNKIIVDSDEQQLLFITYDDPNYFFSDNKRLWDYTSDWFDVVQRRSHSVSSDAERNRLKLFNYCFSRIDKARQYIQSMDH